jgi:hypothetical protein
MPVGAAGVPSTISARAKRPGPPKAASGIATLRSERGYSATNYDASAAQCPKCLRSQIGRKYDVKRVRNSYCRTVDSQRLSNGKKKGDNNQKCGNRYLAWAFVEAAHFARRFDEQCRRWYDRKAARTSTIIATKALACKLAKAAWYLMAEGSDYDPKRVFPELAAKQDK